MTTKAEKDKVKQLQDKCQAVLTDLLRDEDNKYCVDCDSKGPRWASWNLGVFLCIRCAGIHRNLGVHISKVKSVNLDTWTPEQVVSLQQMGNSRARAVYEANLPDNFRRPQNDSSLETFIRAKYEHKKYIAREWVPPAMPKVNWEKEIDDEIERQKRKKKTIVEKKSLGSVEVPQLPKPKNPSPKPGRAAVVSAPSANTSTTITETKQSADLLGLQNGEDGFSSFLSAPTKDEKEEKNESSKSEEESFFNQTAPTEKERIKLTKDSILALYGSAPPAGNFNQSYPSQTGQVPFGNFPAQQTFQNFGASFAQQSFPAQNGMQTFNANNQMQQFSGQFQSQSQFSVGQFGAMQQNLPYQGQQAVPNQFQQFQSQSHFQSNSPFQSLPSQFGQINQFSQQNFPAQPVPNPFYANQNTLQQQFSSLTMNSQPTTNTVPTLATNIWQ